MTTTQNIALSRLTVDPLNVRQNYDPAKDDKLDELIASIRESGLINSLTVRKDGRRLRVTAGQRRLHALKALAKSGELGDKPKVLCHVMEGDALTISVAENTTQQPMDPLQAYEAFTQLQAQGASVEEIGRKFGWTCKRVRQALALGTLEEGIRELYREGAINANHLQKACMGTPERQREWIELFRAGEVQAWSVGNHMVPRDIDPGTALFDLDAVEGLSVVEDLFSDRKAIRDADLFWQHQNAAIDAKVKAFEDDGWKVHRLDPSQYFESWKFEEATREDGGAVYVQVKTSGELVIHQGYRRRKTGGAASDKAPQEIPGKAQQYFRVWREMLVRADLLKSPQDALALLVVALTSGKSQFGYGREYCVFQHENADDPQWDQSDDVKAISDAIGALPQLEAWAQPGEVFAAWRDLRSKSIEELTAMLVTLGSLSISCDGFIDLVGETIGTTAKGRWSGDEVAIACFRGKLGSALLLESIGGAELAQAHEKDTVKVRHGAALQALNDSPDWIPNYLAFPIAPMADGGRLEMIEGMAYVRRSCEKTSND